MNSRSKGCRGERDAAAAWSSLFGPSRRGRQFSGSPESPDIVVPQDGIHVEVKRVERGNPYSWMNQAIADAGDKVPVVLHRRNNQDWLLIVRLADVPRMAKELGAAAETVGNGAVPPAVLREGLPPSPGQNE